MQLHQAEAWMISFSDITTKKKKAEFPPRKFVGSSENFMEEENDQDIINDVAGVVGVLGETSEGAMDEELLEKMHINHTTFNLLLNTLWDGLVLTPTNFVPEPALPDRQLAALLYRLAQGVTDTVLEDIFRISKESGCVFFNKVIRLIVA